MKTMLIGKGHLGTFLRDRLKPAFHHLGSIKSVVQADLEASDIVVVAAGKTSLEFCESNPVEAWNSNVVEPLDLLRRTKHQLMIHISSGCVWDGPYNKDGRPFGPQDSVSPACFYSWTKAACDAMMLQEAHRRNLVILRPRQVYSPVDSPRNTLTKLRSYGKLIDTPNSMTSAETIAEAIKYWSNNEFTLGGTIMNVYDVGIITPYEVGMMLHEAGLREMPEKMLKSELDKTLVPRRVDTVLKDSFFEAEVHPPNIREELRKVISDYSRGWDPLRESSPADPSFS